MKKSYYRLIAAVAMLAVALSLAAMASYAWLTLSGSPVVEGVQINVGGNDSILIAADTVRQTSEGVVHYPAAFGSTLNISQHEEYEYLNALYGLTPVSTADGINWFLPSYYEAADRAVQEHRAVSGQLKPISEFAVDNTLAHANLPQEQKDIAARGSYIYLDFWVVSPAADYDLRVSTGTAENGSYAVGVMKPQRIADGNAVQLLPAEESAEASVRIGFLANEETVTDTSMQAYMESGMASNRYLHLKGVYQEKNSEETQTEVSRFTIYEPNGDLHPAQASYVQSADGVLSKAYRTGTYVITTPIALQNGTPVLEDIRHRLTVQKTSRWITTENGDVLLEQLFRAENIDKAPENNLEEMTDSFYRERLQGQYGAYITKGSFFKNTADLYDAAIDGVVNEEHTEILAQAGATEDITITTLEKNVPQRIRMFIWLEGQDVDCVNSAAASGLAVNVELAGSR